MLRFGIAGLALAAGVIAAAAQDMKSPRIAPTHVDWDAVAVELDALDVPKPVVVPEVMAKLNRATSERFANIAASPVPVLLPFDMAAFVRDRAAAASDPAAASANAPASRVLANGCARPRSSGGDSETEAVSNQSGNRQAGLPLFSLQRLSRRSGARRRVSVVVGL